MVDAVDRRTARSNETRDHETGRGAQIRGHDISTRQLPNTAYDIPSLGAALKLQSMREPQRNFNTAQGDSRRAEEVPPGAQLRSVPALQIPYERRIKEEARRLKRMYPHYRKVK